MLQFSVPLKRYSRYNEEVLAQRGLNSAKGPTCVDKWEHFQRTEGMFFGLQQRGYTYVQLTVFFDEKQFESILVDMKAPNSSMPQNIVQFSARYPSVMCKYLKVSNEAVFVRRFQIGFGAIEEFESCCKALITTGFVVKSASVIRTGQSCQTSNFAALSSQAGSDATAITPLGTQFLRQDKDNATAAARQGVFEQDSPRLQTNSINSRVKGLAIPYELSPFPTLDTQAPANDITSFSGYSSQALAPAPALLDSIMAFEPPTFNASTPKKSGNNTRDDLLTPVDNVSNLVALQTTVLSGTQKDQFRYQPDDCDNIGPRSRIEVIEKMNTNKMSAHHQEPEKTIHLAPTSFTNIELYPKEYEAKENGLQETVNAAHQEISQRQDIHNIPVSSKTPEQDLSLCHPLRGLAKRSEIDNNSSDHIIKRGSTTDNTRPVLSQELLTKRINDPEFMEWVNKIEETLTHLVGKRKFVEPFKA